MHRTIFLLLLGVLPIAPAQAALKVFTCEPEWMALVQELGGAQVTVASATTALQDPHHIEARPSLIAKTRQADLLVCTGAGLEAGWLPPLLRTAGNPRVQPGQPGNFEAASAAALLEVRARADRSEGDVHPEGNPHLHLDARNIARVAEQLAARLKQIDPGNAAHYAARHADFARRWQTALTRWEREAAPLKGMPVVYHHRNWVYLAHWLGLKEIGVLEPKPGLPPTAAHLTQLLTHLREASLHKNSQSREASLHKNSQSNAQPARAIVRSAYEDGRADAWLSERAQIPALVLPYTVGAEGADDLFKLFDITIARLKEAAR